MDQLTGRSLKRVLSAGDICAVYGDCNDGGDNDNDQGPVTQVRSGKYKKSRKINSNVTCTQQLYYLRKLRLTLFLNQNLHKISAGANFVVVYGVLPHNLSFLSSSYTSTNAKSLVQIGAVFSELFAVIYRFFT